MAGRWNGLAAGAIGFCLLGPPAGAAAPDGPADPRLEGATPAGAPYVDAHVHIDQNDAGPSVAFLTQAMARLGTARIVVQTAPYGPDNPARWDIEQVQAALRPAAGRVAMTGGGGTLNPMLVEAYRSGKAGPEARKALRERAEAILRAGAVGFGELSNEHLSLPSSGVKDYEYYPANSPLMLYLADIAAEHDVPIDLHMEAAPQDIPSGLPAPNPKTLHANFAALEALLAHNPRTRIIWAHVGSDNTGYRTAARMRPLLKAHPNLYMEIKYDPGAPGKNPPVIDGRLQPEWLKLFTDFPDRFILGTDQRFDGAARSPLDRERAGVSVLAQLPPDLRRRIAYDNPMRIYRLKP